MADRVVYKKVPLSKPVKAHDETLTELVFHEPTGKDLLNLPMPGMEELSGGSSAATTLASSMAGVPTSVIEELTGKDAVAVAKVVNPFVMEVLTSFVEA